jgi:hypothetical protein
MNVPGHLLASRMGQDRLFVIRHLVPRLVSLGRA